MRMPLFRAATAALLTLAALACQAKDAVPKPRVPERAHIIKDVPAIAGSRLRDTTGSQDAERRTYVVQAEFDSVRAFYRRQLPLAGWAIVGDLGDSTALYMYARKGEQTLWVHLRKLDPATTEYTLIANIGGATAPADTGT